MHFSLITPEKNQNFQKFQKNLKKHKFALFSENVRDRAKRTEIGDHMHSHWSQLKFVRNFFKNLNLHLSQKRLDRAK